jgi:iron complex outermembrane receptor protein
VLVTFGGSLNNTKLKDAGLGVPPGGSLKVNGAFPTVQDPLVNGIAMIDGNALPNAPKWTYNLTARWSIPLASGDEVYVYTDWAYRSKVNFFLYEATEFTGKALTEGGLRVGYLWGNGKYEAAGFVRNLTNQVRVTGAIDWVHQRPAHLRRAVQGDVLRPLGGPAWERPGARPANAALGRRFS